MCYYEIMESGKAEAQLVASVIAAAQTTRISHPSWRLEVALSRVAEGGGPAADTARWWVVLGPDGPAVAGIERHLVQLEKAGALSFSPDRRGFVVDPLWREIERSRLGEPGAQPARAVQAGAFTLDALEARRRVVPANLS